MSLENLQAQSKLTPFIPKTKLTIKTMNIDFWKKWVWTEFGKSLENLQTLSKLRNKMRAQVVFLTLLEWLHAYVSWKKSCARIVVFWVWRFSKLIFCLVLFFWRKKGNLKKTIENWHQENIFLWVWSEFGDSPNSVQTHICSKKYFHFCLYY